MARNRGLLARDLTEAAFLAGSLGERRYNPYHHESAEIATAVNAVVARIGELERETNSQAKRIAELEAGYREIQKLADRLRIPAEKKETNDVF